MIESYEFGFGGRPVNIEHRRKARARWPKAISIVGSGRFASVSHCPPGITVELFDHWREAAHATYMIDGDGCRDECVWKHEVVELP